MPTAVSTGTNTSAPDTGSADDMQTPISVVPFVRASGLHRELVYDGTWTLTGAQQNIPQIDVNAYGYARGLVVLVEGTAGAGTGATTTEDGPFNVFGPISVLQPNGFPFYQVSSGYHAAMIHKHGGYQGYNDPRAWKRFLYTTGAGTAPNVAFGFRIPFELNIREALGSMPNKNQAAPFKLNLTLNSLATVFGGTPTSPSLRIRVILEAWDQPPADLDGQSTQTTPPAMNTIQYWTEQPISVQAGQFSARATRMGNYLRMHIPILRRGGTSRANGEADWPDPMLISLDARNQEYITKANWDLDVYEKWGYGSPAAANDTAGGRDNGVFPYDWAHEFDGRVGHENRDLWLPTIEPTRFEYQGVWGNAGVLMLLTNDVAPQGNVFI